MHSPSHRSQIVSTTLALFVAVALGPGSLLADPPQLGREEPLGEDSRLSDDAASRLAERLSGRPPGPRIESGGKAQPYVAPDRSQVRTCFAQAGSGSDGCAVARRLSHMRPCLDPHDCQAYEMWKEIYRQPEPRMVPAEPSPLFGPTLAGYEEEEPEEEE